MNPEDKPKPRGPTHTWEIVGTVIALLTITLFGFIPEAYRGDELDPTKAGQFGDFIGGYFGTVFLVISVAVLIGSYRNQRFANQVSAFESRFFELLRYHRDNTVEIEVDSIKGRRAFVSFLREWRLLLPLAKEAEVKIGAELSVVDRAALCYLAFYNGSGPNARRTFIQAASKSTYPPELVAEVLERMSDERAFYKAQERANAELGSIVNGKAARPLAYTPYEGHHSRLAHYFRHLFHLVKYAANHAPEKTAQEYVDLVRAQLTTHEQAVLALHAASVDGPWRSQSYLQDFHLIKNIPMGFLTDEEFPVRTVFPKVGYADSNT